jgi:hypothetical protein
MSCFGNEILVHLHPNRIQFVAHSEPASSIERTVVAASLRSPGRHRDTPSANATIERSKRIDTTNDLKLL